MEGKEMVQRYRNQINEAATPAAFGRNFVYGSARANQDRSTWPKETKRYVPAVLSHYKNIKQGRGKGQTAPAPAPAGAQPSTPAPAQPKRPAMLNGVQLGPTREAAAKLEAQTQGHAVDGLGENGAEEDTNVYLPAQAIESYNQENPGLLEDLGIVVEPVEGTSEVKLTAEQYEALEDVVPELAEASRTMCGAARRG